VEMLGDAAVVLPWAQAALEDMLDEMDMDK
jgi:hypothetical protein